MKDRAYVEVVIRTASMFKNAFGALFKLACPHFFIDHHERNSEYETSPSPS